MDNFLLDQIRSCQLCQDLPLGIKPILQFAKDSPILIAGQAPGRKTHAKGLPFDDLSGDRLRRWLGVDRDDFYDSRNFAIVPMGFCYPGSGKHGDLPPRPICRETWHEKIRAELINIKLTIAIGRYAIAYYLGESQSKNLTFTVGNWQSYAPTLIPLPHPSPRNQRWWQNNPWFEVELIPELQARVAAILKNRL